jgi:hypothetical protein
MGIAEGSLYKAFQDMPAVLLAAFARSVTSRGAGGRRGCLIVASKIDMATSDPDIARRSVLVFDGHERRLVDFIRLGQVHTRTRRCRRRCPDAAVHPSGRAAGDA